MKLTLLLTAAVATAAPLKSIRRGCTEGHYNCLDGKTFQQCISGGAWSVVMPVAPGTSCKTGISENPWLSSENAVPIASPVITPVENTVTTAPPVNTPVENTVAAAPSVSTPVENTASIAPPASTPVETTIATAATTTTLIQAITITSQAPTSSSSEVPAPTTVNNPPPPPPVVAHAPISTPANQLPTASPPQPSAPQAIHIPAGANTGNGKFKSMKDWPSFEKMVATQPIGKCSASWGVADNSEEETKQLINAIKTQSANVDPRFVLAVVMQESSGCVRVPTTNNGVRNPGLMQDSNGAHTCNENGVVQNPCPVEQINGMISDGVQGGDNNYKKNLDAAIAGGMGDSFAYAVAARIFNSGSVDMNNLSNGFTSDNTYVNKIMGKLAGS